MRQSGAEANSRGSAPPAAAAANLSSEKLDKLRNQLSILSSRDDAESKLSSFLTVLSLYRDCLFDELSQSQLKREVLPICEQILSCAPLFHQNLEAFAHTFDILGISQMVCFCVPNPAYVAPLFLRFCEIGQTRKDILSAGQLFFETLFSDDGFAKGILGSDLPRRLFLLFAGGADKYTMQWALGVVLNRPRDSAIAQVSAIPIFTEFRCFVEQNSCSRECLDIVAEEMAKFSCRCAKTTKGSFTNFANFDGFNLVQTIVIPSKWQQVFLRFLTCAVDFPRPGYVHFFDFLHQLCVRDGDRQCDVFRLLVSFKRYDEVNVLYPLSQFYGIFLMANDTLVDLLEDIDQHSPTIVGAILPAFFSAITREATNANFYQRIMQIVRHQIEENFCDIIAVAQMQFLDVCIVRPSAETRLEIVRQAPWVTDFIFRICRVPQAEHIHPAVLLALLEISEVPGHATRFLKAFPFHPNVRALLVDVDFKKFSLSVFQTSEKCADEFVSSNGLAALNAALAEGIVSLDFFAEFLAVLVSLRRFEQVDEFILGLPSGDPIYSLSCKQYHDIVFGKNYQQFRPIRVASLFHCLELPDVNDPYNCYLLGRYAISKYLNKGCEITSIPLITPVANRYLRPCHALLLLKELPNLYKYCDTSTFGHFPLFPLYPGQGELVFGHFFKSLSFWFKFDRISKKPICFFRSNATLLSIHNRELVITIAQAEFRHDWSALRWYHVLLRVEETHKNNTIFVILNGMHEFSTATAERDLFNSAGFSNPGDGFLFLGAAIKFSSSPDPGPLDLNNPGAIDNVMTNSIAVTPFNLFALKQNTPISDVFIPQTCQGVQYFGFPLHFFEMSRMAGLFSMLESTETVPEFRSLFHAILATSFLLFEERSGASSL
jgi:hypothetical protein